MKHGISESRRTKPAGTWQPGRHEKAALRRKSDAPAWGKSERFERIARFDLDGTPADIFPLLCPVLEYRWLPDWRCKMFYSQSGAAEKDAVFHTTERPGVILVWTVVTYEPDTFIEYLMTSGTRGVIRLSIALEQGPGRKTHVTWRMLFTSTSALAAGLFRRLFSEEGFAKMIDDRKKQLDHFLATGKMLGS